jgi:hypothetical protein
MCVRATCALMCARTYACAAQTRRRCARSARRRAARVQRARAVAHARAVQGVAPATSHSRGHRHWLLHAAFCEHARACDSVAGHAYMGAPLENTPAPVRVRICNARSELTTDDDASEEAPASEPTSPRSLQASCSRKAPCAYVPMRVWRVSAYYRRLPYRSSWSMPRAGRALRGRTPRRRPVRSVRVAQRAHPCFQAGVRARTRSAVRSACR